MSNNLFDDDLKKQLPLDDANVIYDHEKQVEEAPTQKKNKRQLRKERQQNLQLAKRSNSSIKKEKKKEHDKRIREKYNRRDEIVKVISQRGISEDAKAFLTPTSLLGKKMTKKQKYQDNLARKNKGLPYDQDLIDKYENREHDETESESSDSEFDQKIEIDEDDDQPITLKERIVDKPMKPLIKITQGKIEIHQEEKPAAPRPAINVQLNRPEGVDEIRSNLPIIEEEQVIVETIHENDAVIICGETGSGKTTQIPQFLYEAGYGTRRTLGKICITEPRRVAAINMSKRVAYEMGLRWGQEVGYHIRNNKFYTGSTTIKFCTDGILLREAEEDLLLSKYSVIIIDEAHERTVNTDVLIGLLSQVIKLRRKKFENGEMNVEPLKLIIMSATLRVDDFLNNQRLFEVKPPLIEIKARQFKVDVHFSQNTPSEGKRMESVKKCVELIHERMPPGGILVFLPGKNEINECVAYFKNYGQSASKKTFNPKPIKSSNKPTKTEGTQSTEDSKTEQNKNNNNETTINDDTDIFKDEIEEIVNPPENLDIVDKQPMICLPLYSMLPQEEQDKAFQIYPDDVRVVVFSTNIAETSVTIPNIRYVVDLGLEKSRNFDFNRGVTTTKVDFISKASAKQREGRAGRTGPGYCFRLYSSGFFSNFAQFTEPEIKRRPITEIVLLLKTMGLNDISQFPFPTTIEPHELEHSELILRHIGLLENEPPYKATRLGTRVSLFPIEPRLGKLIVTASKFNCTELAIALAAGLDAREPLSGRPEDENLISKRGDPFTLLHIFGAYLFEKSKNREKQFCSRNHVNQKAMEEIQMVREQLTEIVLKIDKSCLKSEKAGLLQPDRNMEAPLAQCLFSSFCDHVAKYNGKNNSYTAADSKVCELRNVSSLYDKKEPYVTYISIDEVNEKKYLRCVCQIYSPWITQLGSKLLLQQTKLGTPKYRPDIDGVYCDLEATFGQKNWRLIPASVQHPDPYKCFACALLKGEVIPQFAQFTPYLISEPSDLESNRQLPQRLLMIVAALKKDEVASRKALEEKFAKEPLYLLTQTLMWYSSKKAQDQITQNWPFKSKTPLPQAVFSDSDSDSD